VDQSVPVVGGQRLPGDLYLIRKRLANGDVYKLYLRHGLDGKDQILVDPTKVKLGAPNQAKGTNAILDGSLSNDNRYIAVDIAPGGSERDAELHAFEVSSGRETGDVILHAQGGVSWLPDNRSFVYNRLQKLPPGAPVTEIEQKVRAYLHVLGSAMSAWHETRRSCVVSAGRERSLSFECIVLPPEFCFTAILVLRKLGTRSAFWEEKTQVRHIPGRR